MDWDGEIRPVIVATEVKLVHKGRNCLHRNCLYSLGHLLGIQTGSLPKK